MGTSDAGIAGLHTKHIVHLGVFTLDARLVFFVALFQIALLIWFQTDAVGLVAHYLSQSLHIGYRTQLFGGGCWLL